MKRPVATAGPAAFLVAAAVWSLVSAAATGGSAAGPAFVLTASAATLILAVSVPERDRWVVPATVAGAAVVLAVTSGKDVFSSLPAHGPFSYANATGAFWLQAGIAGRMLTVVAPKPLGRWLGWACSVAFTVIVFASASRAAAALLVVPAAAFVAARLGAGRIAVRAMVALLAVVAAATVVLGATDGSGPSGGRDAGGPGRAEAIPDERILDERRLALWHDALVLIRDNPVAGVGPGRFAKESPVAAADPDARWAHHGFLQFGAETGLLGLALLSIAFAWAIGAVGSGAKPEILSVLGVAALVALGTGACLDYLMHFPAIPLATAALTGAAINRSGDETQ